MKKFCSLLLAFVLVLSIFPVLKPEVSAANGIQTKIDLIKSVYGTGSYFTSDGKSHYMYDYSVCPEDPNNSPMPYRTCKCSLSQNTKKTTGLYSGAEVAAMTGCTRWQCAAFATYVFYNIFNKDYGTCGTVNIANAKLGDVVVFDFDKSSYSEDHYGIFLYTSGSNVYVYDANSDYRSKVVYGSAYAKSSVVKVFRASNYDSVNGSTSSNINYVTGLAGTYYLQSKNTGYHLAVSEGKDASLQPINTWGTWWSNFKVKLTAQGNAYKITFPEVSSLLVNPYSDTPANGTKINLYKDVNDSSQWWGFEKVGDAYVIRCMYNPSLVLTENGTGQATLTTYNGSAKQLWYLRSHVCGLVSYNANGGSGAPASQSKYYNVTLSLHTTKPTRSGYTFLGWATSPTASSVAYSAGAAYSANSGVTLYAVWQKNHAHSYTGTVTKAPTCTQPGVRTYKCSCGASYTQSIPSTGHTKSEWIIDVAGTGNSAGSKHKECTKCGAVLETTVIPQLKPVTPEITSVTNSTNGVKVIWGKASGADSYIVYRRAYNATTKKWSGWSRLADGVTSTSYVDKTAKSGTYYRYTIKATNEAGYSGYNTSGVKTYFLSRPQVTSTSNNNSGINIKWNKVTGANGYVVYRKTTGGWTKVATVKGNGTVSYTDKTATAGVTYRYTIRAYYGSYLSSFVVNGYAVRRLTTPSLKSVTSAQRGITFKWNKVTGATGYIVYRKSDNGSWQNMGKITGTTVVDTSAKKGVTYTYTVRAYYGTSTSYYNTKGLTIKDKY